MKQSDNKSTNYLTKVIQDEQLHREWERIYNNTSSLNLGSESDTDFIASKGASSENQLSRFLKNARFSFDLQESVQIGGTHRHAPDLALYRQKIHQLFQVNSVYRQKLGEIKNLLVQTIRLIHDNLSKNIKNFQYFEGCAEESSLEETHIMANFIKKSLQNLYYEGMPEMTKLKEEYEVLKLQKSMMAKDNESLMSYIEQRKKYSENLKAKIVKLKDQVKDVAIREQTYRNILEGLDKYQGDVDLKYMGRNEMVMTIKSLVARIIKHSKQCRGVPNPESLLSMDLDKIGVKSGQFKLKDSSPYKDRSSPDKK